LYGFVILPALSQRGKIPVNGTFVFNLLPQAARNLTRNAFTGFRYAEVFPQERILCQQRSTRI